MEKSAANVDMSGLLELFGYPASDGGLEQALREMREIEQFARCQMRKHLRPSEFSQVQALAEASVAAQDILNGLRARGEHGGGSTWPTTPPLSTRTFQTRS
jgi:hypothetical protein